MHATTFHSDVRIETNLVELCAHVIVADLGQGQFPRTHENVMTCRSSACNHLLAMFVVIPLHFMH